AEREEDRRRHQIRQERAPLVAIKAGRDEHVNLRRDHRERDERRAEHRELELGPEVFEQRGVDEARLIRARDPFEREDQHVVDLAGEEEAADEGEEERDQRLDQPRAQLDQVLHQGSLGRLDLLLVLFGLHAALPPPASGTGSEGRAGAASAKSLLSGGGGSSGIGTDTSAAGTTGAVPSATGSVG